MFNPISNNERQFLISNLGNSLRENRRDLMTYREINIKKLEDNGQVEVKLGNTLVISQIFSKLICPGKDRPNEGVVVFSIDSNNLRPNAEYTQSNEELNELRNKINNLLEKSLKESKALDSNALCLVPGKLVWKIVLDINIINNDGNLYDACMIASLASWMSFKLPFLRKTGNKVELPESPQMINLTTLHVPLSVTFGLFDNNNKFLVDPSLKEEKCIDGLIIISANKFGEICYLHTYGSVKIEKNHIMDLFDVIKEKIFYLNEILKTFVNNERAAKIKFSNKKQETEQIEKLDEINKNEMLIDEDSNLYSKYITIENSKISSGSRTDKTSGGIKIYELKNN